MMTPSRQVVVVADTVPLPCVREAVGSTIVEALSLLNENSRQPLCGILRNKQMYLKIVAALPLPAVLYVSLSLKHLLVNNPAMSLEQRLVTAAVKHEAQEEGCECKCDKNSWPNILTGVGMGGNVFVIVTAILSLIKIPTLTGIILSVYCVLLALFGFLAEARRFRRPRDLIYKVVKHAYFITNYSARSLFYLFLGSIMFDSDSILNIACAIYVVANGIVLFGVNLVVGLPVYLGSVERKQAAEERIRREVEEKYRQVKTEVEYQAPKMM